MYEIFIVLILGSYYLIKYSWLRARDVTSEALEIKRDEDYNRRLNKWESAVTDLEMEKKIRKAVTTLDSLEEYKEEIESVLENEFGIKREDLNYNDFLNVFRGELEDYAKLLFARILMGNRGRLLKYPEKMV